jgi:hypothetical protein
MHAVGTSLGVFTALDADRVLGDETPLRDALFDILLTLVEGGALEMRPADDGRYAFRWRADYATAGVDADGHEPIDVEPPSPYLEELARLRRERDDALGRAEFAEALADERERLLRLANVSVPATRMATPGDRMGPLPRLDPEGQSVLDVLYTSRRSEAAPVSETEGDDTTAQRATAQAAAAATTSPDAEREPTSEPVSPEVVYLSPPAAEHDEDGEGPKWTGYTLEQPRPHLSTVEPLADEA